MKQYEPLDDSITFTQRVALEERAWLIERVKELEKSLAIALASEALLEKDVEQFQAALKQVVYGGN